MTDTHTTVLVTGVAGFLGSHLADKLLAEGYRVIGMDNLAMGRLENIEGQLDNPAFRFLRRDITDPESFADLGDQDIAAVAHLAAYKIPRYGATLDVLRINHQGSENVLEFARRQHAKFLLASTSDVYGRNPKLPFAENDNAVLGSSQVARWSYAVSKLFCEHLAFAYQESYQLPVTVVRIFGSYGPRQHLSWWGGPQSVFIDAVLDDEQIPIHGDGLQTRSFTYVSDTVAGLYAALTRPAADGGLFNIGSTHEISILDLARAIKRLSDTPGELNHKLIPYESFTGKRYEDVRRRVPDVSLAERLLGFRAEVGLEEGLRNTITWQRGERQRRPAPGAAQVKTQAGAA